MTVKELIIRLQILGSEHLEVVIDDADTGWYLKLVEINQDNGYAVLSGSYNTRVDKPND